jgi:hypothetical protein
VNQNPAIVSTAASTEKQPTKCDACDQPGAGSSYKGGIYHMTCKIEAKADAGELGPTPVEKPRRKKTGAARFKRLNGGMRT